ncbi:hypothetical protein Xhom_02293 [Xenorhabdus hominickii]|uniref:Uncharacterized protein n=1 Tax=Xenorhabdus hominickii TaxID=351679 RepID=A0A2G0Q8J3_XENHO|nr:hypothetical protein Xhom_02293 [Xenorhabdus hominickii]
MKLLYLIDFNLQCDQRAVNREATGKMKEYMVKNDPYSEYILGLAR